MSVKIDIDLKKKPSLGQVWTPDEVAIKMVKKLLSINPNVKSILDPACGPATFSQHISEQCDGEYNLTCYDLDPRMVETTFNVHAELGIKGKVICKDYLTCKNNEGDYDAVIMNPPYIRQENINPNVKKNTIDFLCEKFGEKINKKSNLYVLFILKALVDLKDGGVLCFIVYDSITQSVYGKDCLHLLSKLADKIEDYKIKRPFTDVLVDAHVFLFKKNINKTNEDLKKVFLVGDKQDCCIYQLAHCRRGTGLPNRKIFIADKEDKFFSYASPFFVKQSTLKNLLVKPDKKAYLFESNESAINDELVEWIDGKAKKEGYNLKRIKIKGVKGKIIFNYYIRDKPRFLWNPENVYISDNFYVVDPILKGSVTVEAIWLLLNSDLYMEEFIKSARSQGNGLLKLQLFEFKETRVLDWNNLHEDVIAMLHMEAKKLIKNEADYSTTKMVANKIILETFK